ncbi:MAG: glycosyltransferase family 2 protein [Candidatus Hodarchaeota archaeon]
MSTMMASNHQRNLRSTVSRFFIICAILSWVLGAHFLVIEIFEGNSAPVVHVVLIVLSILIMWLSFALVPLESPLIGLERGSQLVVLFFLAMGGYFSFISSDNDFIRSLLGLQGNIDFLILFVFFVFLAGNIATSLRLTTRNFEPPLFTKYHNRIRSLSDRLSQEGRSRPRISFVIPALNEEAVIVETLQRIPSAKLERLGFESEIIVVDNGSEDRTGELAASSGARVIVEPQRGYGSAYKAGFKAVTGDIVVMSDADGTYPVEKAYQLIKPILDERADVVIGSRFMGTIREGAMTGIHKFGNRLLTLQLNVLFAFPFKKPISDAHSGFRAFQADALRELELNTSGMEFASELVIESYAKSLQMVEIPIDYSPRVPNSLPKLRTIRDGARHLFFMFNTRVTGKRATRFFATPSLRRRENLSEKIRFGIGEVPLTFLIPAYNEEGSIGLLLKNLNYLYPHAKFLVVNNNSFDKTADIAEHHGALVINERKQGKANAVLAGMRFLQGMEKSDIIIMLDADMTYLPRDARKLIFKLVRDDLDIVIGSRIRGVRTPRSMSPMNLFGNVGLSLMARFLYRQNLTDVCSGYWAFRPKAIEKVLNKGLKSQGFALEAELVAKATEANLKIGEIPIRYSHRFSGNSSLKAFQDGLKIMKTMIKCKQSSFKNHSHSDIENS